MTGFVIGAAVAVLLSFGLLLRPFFTRSTVAPASRRQLNAAIYREELARLEQDLAQGTISAADSVQAKTELQRRVLQDASQEEAAPALRAPRKTLAAIALLLPLAAAGLYFGIGNPASMNPAAAVASSAAPQDVERMVAGLAAKLEKEPGNLKGWAMLGRSYKVMGRPQEAERAYDRAGAFMDGDAQLLADYADVAAANAAGDFAGKPARLIARALQVDPQNPMALWLSGTAALNAGRYDKAIATWEGLMKLLQPGGDDARMLQSALDDARSRGGATAGAPPAAPAAMIARASVTGTVQVASALKSKIAPGDTVMVIARLPGSRMPVAVLRVRGAALPMVFTLDDSLAMSPESLISTAAEVQVEARISRSGLAKAEPGDLVSSPQTIKVGSRGVTLDVSHVRP
jgi:cytochrome c-type biogenesis protein CcmH